MERKIGRIYRLVDPITNKIRYIGQTRLTIQERLKNHFKDRNQAKNTNNHNGNWIAKLYRVYKIKPIIELIQEELLDDNELNEKEIYWINYYLNLGCDLTNTSLNPQFRCKNWKKFIHGKKIYCYDRNLNEIVFINGRKAADALNTSYKLISECSIENKASEYYVFSFSQIKNNKEIISRFENYDLRKIKTVCAVNISTNEVLKFKNQFYACKILNLNFRNVNLVLKKKRKSCGGYYWYYDNEEFIIPKSKIKKVIYLPTNQVFNSTKECALFLKLTENYIRSNIYHGGKNLKFKYILEN